MPITILLSGLSAGAVHVLMGPDHLAAVAPLALQQSRRPWLLGMRWGVGHAGGVVLVAVLAWLLRELLPVEAFSAHCERLVGVMLIGIGAWGLRKALKFDPHAHAHEHSHEGSTHQHLHTQGSGNSHTHGHAALGIGVLHGLAGASHFLGVLPALAMPTRTAAAIYLLAFGLGTILVMAAFSHAFGKLGSRLSAAGTRTFRGSLATCACAAMAVGAYWLVS